MNHSRWLALSILCLASCTPADTGPPLVPVEGIVTLDGQPLAAATVTLIPIGETRGQGGGGQTDEAGKFAIKTPDGKRTGSVVGSYQVQISKLVNPDGTPFVATPDVSPMDSAAREQLAKPYSDLGQLRLQATVGDQGTTSLEFKLTSKPPH